MTEPVALPRETGAEKAPQTCPNCGAEVAAIEAPYGGISGANCPKCYPVAIPESTPREQAQAPEEPPRVTGTDVTGAGVPSSSASGSSGGSV